MTKRTSPPENCLFVGIDYSYTSPAICFLGDDFKSSVFHFATYNCRLAESYKNYHGHLLNCTFADIERYKEIAEWASNIIQKQCAGNFENVKVALEGFSYGSSKSLTFNIAENAGILKLYLLNLGIVPTIIPPTTAKKHFSGSGRANKEDMRQALIDKEGVDIVEWLGMKRLNSPAHDIVDSYAIALTLKDKLNNGVS